MSLTNGARSRHVVRSEVHRYHGGEIEHTGLWFADDARAGVAKLVPADDAMATLHAVVGADRLAHLSRELAHLDPAALTDRLCAAIDDETDAGQVIGDHRAVDLKPP